jgi:hypothetical protein
LGVYHFYMAREVVLKLKQYSSKFEDGFVDMWIDAKHINGFLIPFDEKTGRQSEDTINLIFHGDILTVKQERHVMEYLVDNFIEAV